ncbi:MAG: AAA family ATPase, partial [Bacteroidaceae bacterium]|nr:AAA family ATPase [Bacteroidaceae bacterium]
MAHYINLGNEAFASARADEYVDKTGLIACINGTLFTESRFSCISRCRRFGKSMAAKMLCAYYDKSCDSRELFRGLEIENHPDFEKHLNKYSVIYIDMTNYISDHGHDNDIVARLQREVKDDVIKAYPDVTLTDNTRLMDVLIDIALATGDRFVVIIDEWDAICREFSPSEKAMDEYVRLLRRMFKSIDAMGVFAAVYMTGILPMKRYETQSAINNFWEYSMIQPGPLASFFGFTREEVKDLCDKHGMAFEDMVKWYDGYNIGRQASMFNPSSVMKALKLQEYGNFWATTGAFDAVARYIKMDFDGLRKSIVQMLGGIPCKVDTSSFSNDPHIIRDR